MRWLLLVACACAGCGGEEARNLRLELLVRGSCMPSTHYDLSCVHAIEVGLVAGGQQHRRQCTVVTGRFSTMQELVANRDFVPLLQEVRARPDARLDVRGYAAIDKSPCVDTTDADLVFWGTSAAVDLSDEALTTVTVELECRPECDCAAMVEGEAGCPHELTPGVCAPPSNRPCRRQCDIAEDCYDGLIQCGGDGICAPESGETCAVCASSDECDSGLCVHNTDEPNEWFCAPACPALPNVDPCPPRMSCKRLGNGVFEPTD